MGRKKQAHFRIVVADSAAPRDGRFVDTLGYYKPLTSPARLVVDIDKADLWISKGAELTGTVRTLLNKARKGGDDSVALGEPDHEEAKAIKAAAIEERKKAKIKSRTEEKTTEEPEVAEPGAAEPEAAEEADSEGDGKEAVK
jgi:small subunit ribosomal protein S16